MWCLYYLQGTLYESGTLISQILMFLLLAVTLYYCVYANQHYKLPSAMKVLNTLLIFFTIYGAFILLFGNGVGYVSDYIYLKAIYMSLLPIYPFYVFTKKGELTEKVLRIWVFVFIPVAIASFLRDQREALIAAMEQNSSREEFTLNAGYIFLSIIPILPLFKKQIVQYALLAVCSYFVITAMKRGAILIGGLCLLYFIMSSFHNQKTGKRIWIFVLSVGIMALAYYAFHYMLENSDYFNMRLDQTRAGDASGRDSIFETLWSYFLNSNIFYFLFGHGADATLRVVGYAHNDWIEIAVNNGVLGLVLYFFYWTNMYKTYKRTDDNGLKKMMGLFILIYFVRSFFSMSYNDIPIYATAALGYALASRDMIKQKELLYRT